MKTEVRRRGSAIDRKSIFFLLEKSRIFLYDWMRKSRPFTPKITKRKQVTL